MSSVAEPYVITLEDLFALPLHALLAAAGVLLVESSIADDDFFGAACVSPTGVSLHLPQGRPAVERDSIARLLLGQVLGVPLAPPPGGLAIEETAV